MPSWTFADVHGGVPKCALSWEYVRTADYTFTDVSVASLPRLLPRRGSDRFERREVRRAEGTQGQALAESRRDELVTALGKRRSPTTSRFSITTTVQELSDWWLESVARHQVRESSLATYRKSVAYLVDELGHVRAIDVGPLTTWQSALLDRLAPYTVLSACAECS